MKYSCSNCKNSVDAKKFRGSWAGLACGKIVGVNHPQWDEKAYIVGYKEDTVLIVEPTFLCILYEPKE